MYSIEGFLEMFNNGDLEVEKYFNDYETWFNILKRKGLMDDVDPKNATDSERWLNEYILWLYDNDKPNYYKWVLDSLNDVIMEDNKLYWLDERKDLARLFCDGNRYDLDRDTVEKILSGDDVFEPFWDTTDDLYRDVIEELNEKNLNHLKNYIVKILKGQKLSPETEEMELIASEQGHGDYWEITEDNVSRIIDNEEAMKSLLNDELADLKAELYSIHSQAYNSAYESEVYDEIFSELDKYFDTKEHKWIITKHPWKQNTQVEKYRLPIRDFEGIVNDFLFSNRNYGSSGNLDNYGSFIEMIKEDRDCLHAQAPDYPDSRLVDKNINEYFSDYI